MLRDAIGYLLAAACLPGAAYLLTLTLAAMLPARSRASRAPARETVRIALVVPAHDEASDIGATLANLRDATAGTRRCDIVVIADNCGDDTAAIAAAAGATVLERHDPARRGKGHALEYAFARLPQYDWFLVIDADSRFDAASLQAMRDAMARGADALQCRYLGADAPGCGRAHAALAQVAWFGWNLVRPRGRARLGLSCGLLGNGFALSRATLERVPYASASIVEDADYHARLVRAGVRVDWVDAATVRAPAAPTRQAAAVQRARWTGGRLALLRTQWRPCLRAVVAGRWRLADPLCDLLLPPITWFALAAAALAAWPDARVSAAGVAMIAILALHVAVAMRAGRATRRHWLALLRVPLHLLWSLAVLPRALRFARHSAAWIRTPRGPHAGDAP